MKPLNFPGQTFDMKVSNLCDITIKFNAALIMFTVRFALKL